MRADFLEKFSGEMCDIELTKEHLAKLLIDQKLKGFRTRIRMVKE